MKSTEHTDSIQQSFNITTHAFFTSALA